MEGRRYFLLASFLSLLLGCAKSEPVPADVNTTQSAEAAVDAADEVEESKPNEIQRD